jgi:hypothetical protein
MKKKIGKLLGKNIYIYIYCKLKKKSARIFGKIAKLLKPQSLHAHPPLACYRNFIVDHQSVPACQSVMSNKQLKQLQ